MKVRRIITLGRFAALFIVAGAFACDGTDPDPDPNRAPVAVGGIPPLTLTEGESYEVDASQFFTDPDGDQLSYSATSSNNSVLTVSVSGSNVTATAVAAGTAEVTVTATDPDGLSASHTISVMVQAANQAPVVSDTIPPQTLTEGDTVTIDASGYFSDPDGDALAFSAESSDADAATAAVDGSAVTIVAVAEGTATVTVTATDPQAASAMQEFTVTVEPRNRAPVAVGEIPPLDLDEGEEFTAPIDQFFSDPDGDTLAYEAAVSDTTVVTASISGTMIAVLALAEGMATITIAATDPGGLSATQTAAITVMGVNRGPTLTDTIPHQDLAVGDTVALDISNTFTDPDGDTLGFMVETDDTAVATVSLDGSMVTLVAVGPGSAFITVTATDPDGASAAQTFAANVAQGNRAPRAVGEIPDGVLPEGQTFTASVEMFFTDPDGDTLSYEAESSDTTVATASMAGSIITVMAVAEGVATITVTATDPEGLSATQTTTISVVSTNRGPMLTDTIPHQNMMPGDTLAFDLSNNFTDPDGDTLTFRAETDDTTVATVSIDGSMVTLVAVDGGSAFITVAATDPDGASAVQTFAANVAIGNRAPMAVGEIAARTITAGDSVTVDVSGNFSDPDDDDLTYTADPSDDAVATVSVSGAMVTVAGVAAGSATVTVTATDPGGLSATQTFDVTVSAANQGPEAVGEIAARTVTAGDSVTVDVSGNFSDPDDDDLTYTADPSDDAVATVSVSGAMVTVTGVGAGSATVTVTATDPGGLSATQTFDVTVSAANQGPEAVGEIAARTVTAGDSVTVDVSGNFSDPDDDDLTYTADPSDDAVATVSVSGAMVAVTGVGAGSATVTVTATDPGGLSATQTFDVTVSAANQGPEAVGEIAARTVTAGDSVTVDVSGNFSDPDDDDLTYTADPSDDAVATVSVSGAMVAVTGVAAGSATVTVTATDPGGLSATQTFDVTVSAANQGPEAVDTVPVYDLLLVLNPDDMTMVDTMTSVVLDMAAYFSDPDGDDLTYMASVSDTGTAKVESVEGSVVTTVAVSSDTTFAHDTTMLTVTATDPDGESVSQEAMVLVANSDYELWDLIVIEDDGRVVLGGLLTLGQCIDVTGFPFDGTVYTVHWTSWQVKKGTGWVNLPGTYRAEGICPNLDLPDAPDGTYRVVGELTTFPFGGDPETESVLSRRRSADYIKTSN